METLPCLSRRYFCITCATNSSPGFSMAATSTEPHALWTTTTWAHL